MMKIIILLYAFVCLAFSAEEREIDLEKEWIYIPGEGNIEDFSQNENFGLIEELCRSNDIDLIKKAIEKITSKQYSDSIVNRLSKEKVDLNEIQRGIILDMIYLYKTGKLPSNLFSNRVLQRKSVLKKQDSNIVRYSNSIKATLLSEKDSVDNFQLQIELGEKAQGAGNINYHLNYASALTFSHGLETAQAQKKVTPEIRRIAEFYWGNLYIMAISQLEMLDRKSFKSILLLKTSSPEKFEEYGYYSTADIISKSKVLSIDEKIEMLESLYKFKHSDNSKILTLIYDLDQLRSETKKVDSSQLIKPIGFVKKSEIQSDEELESELRNLTNAEFIVALGGLLEKKIYKSFYVPLIIERQWNEDVAVQLMYLLHKNPNKIIEDSLRKNFKTIFDYDTSYIRQELFYMALLAGSVDLDESFYNKLVLDFDQNHTMNHRSHKEISSLITLCTRYKGVDFEETLGKLLDETHIIYKNRRKSEVSRIYSHCLYSVALIPGMADKHEAVIVDGLKTLKYGTLNLSASAALKSWTPTKDMGNELKQAISLSLREANIQVRDRLSPGIMPRIDDEERNISNRYLLLDFLASGGDERLKEFEDDLKVASEFVYGWLYSEDATAYASKLYARVK